MCPFCRTEARPSQALGPDMRMVTVCSVCGRPLEEEFADTLLQTAETSTGVSGVTEPRPRATQPSPPTDVLSLAKSRLAQLETELEALAEKQREANMLRRMIAAATPPN